MKLKVTLDPDEVTAALLRHISSQLAALIEKVVQMSQEADDLRREVAETKAGVASMQVKVTEVLSFVAQLKAALANATEGLTAAEVAQMAADLDAAQQDLAGSTTLIDVAVAPAVVPADPTPVDPTPVDPTEPPPAV